MKESTWWKTPNIHEHEDALKAHRNRLDLVDQSSLGLAESIGKLFQLDQAQSRDLQRIESRIQVLADLLIEAGVIDAAQLQERMKASKAQAESTRQAAEVKVVDGSASTICAACKMTVPVEGTFFSEMGEVCERCYRGGAGQLV
jgi:hypothetical protein